VAGEEEEVEVGVAVVDIQAQRRSSAVFEMWDDGTH